jgi:hypothetical protein
MRRSVPTLLLALALPSLGSRETQNQKPVSTKRATTSAKSANSPAKPEEQSSKRVYAELSICELVAEV